MTTEKPAVTKATLNLNAWDKVSSSKFHELSHVATAGASGAPVPALTAIGLGILTQASYLYLPAFQDIVRHHAD